MTPEQVARHEAAHASAAVMLGVPVRRVEVGGFGGVVEYEPHIHTRRGAVRRMVVILAALIESADTPEDLPGWPLDPAAGPDGMRHDRQLLADLASAYSLTQSEWRRILVAALNLSCSPEHERMVTAISGVLDYVPRVDRDLLEQLQTIAEWGTPHDRH